VNPDWHPEVKQNHIKKATREYHIHKKAIHTCVVPMLDVFMIDLNSFCTVLEFVQGCDLDMYLKQKGKLPEREAHRIISKVFAGLKYLSTRDTPIIHYDLKPGNILIHNEYVFLFSFRC
jgi:tousled-like kinase